MKRGKCIQLHFGGPWCASPVTADHVPPLVLLCRFLPWSNIWDQHRHWDDMQSQRHHKKSRRNSTWPIPNVAIFHLPRNGTAGAAAKPQKAFSRMKLHAESTNVLVTLNCRPRWIWIWFQQLYQLQQKESGLVARLPQTLGTAEQPVAIQAKSNRFEEFFRSFTLDRSFHGWQMSRRHCEDTACVSSWVSRSVRASKARCFAWSPNLPSLRKTSLEFVAFVCVFPCLQELDIPATISHDSVSGWHCPCPQHAVHLLNLCVHLVKTVNGYIDMSYDDIRWHGDDSMILCDSMISNLNPLNHSHSPSCPTGRLRLLGFRRWLRIQFSSSLERLATWL